MGHNKTETLLTATGLRLAFADTTVVDDVSLTVNRGQVLGLLGLNGAGKTSTLRMLAGVLAPSDGDVLIDGLSLATTPLTAKANIGYLPEIAPLYPDMRVIDYLRYAGRLRRLDAARSRQRADQLLQVLELEPFAKRSIGKLSKGYKQRVGLAQALVHDPALLILDEPSSGLDPEQMRDMRQLIKTLAADKGVIFSSHLLSEVTELCDSVLVLHHGQVVHQGELGTGFHPDSPTDNHFVARFANPVNHSQLVALPEVQVAEITQPDTWTLETAPEQALRLLPALVNAGLPVIEFAPQRPSLETLFTSLVGREQPDHRQQITGT